MKNISTIALLVLFSHSILAQKSSNANFILSDGWEMQSAMAVSAKGDQISQSLFREPW